MKKLFYSYCHEDEEFRDDLEKHLAMLGKNNLISEWYDRKILPGSEWDREIKAHLRSSDIILLLISPGFLASQSCEEEIDGSLKLSAEKGVTVIPIILKPCAWNDDGRIGGLQVLPNEGRAVTDWPSRDQAFLNIYEGIKAVIESMEFSIKPDFRSRVTQIEFISQDKEDIELNDVFVLPNIVYSKGSSDYRIVRFEGLWKTGNRIILKGEERSGKTTLCRKLFLECVSEDAPVVMVSGQEIRSPKNHDRLIERKFGEQFHGDYRQWKKLKDKTVIIDGLNFNSRLEFIDFAEENFNRIFISTAEDDYLSFFRDQKKFANYSLLTIRPFRRSQQHELIKRWKSLGNPLGTEPETLAHGEIDRIEDSLDSIIHNDKIVPRFPFFILSILQLHEKFMPKDIQITTYGHCYQSLITAQLLKYGIQQADVGFAYNFLTHFAFDIFSRGEDYSRAKFEEFLIEYKKQYLIDESSVVNRLKRGGFISLEDQNGRYPLQYSFVYYFFLGKFFAESYDKYRNAIERLIEESYLRDNRYVLIFMIHHMNKEDLDDLIKTIFQHTMAAMNNWPATKLTVAETKRLASLLEESKKKDEEKIPQNIISEKPIEENRKEIRNLKDEVEAAEPDVLEEKHDNKDVNSVYKSLKNMEVLGQILKNKCGSSTKDKLREIVTSVADTGLRTIALITGDESMRKLEDYLKEVEGNDADEDDIENKLSIFYALCFFIIGGVISKIVDCIKKRELAEIVADVRDKENTPAYDLIDFFFVLETATKLQNEDVEKMRALLKKFSKDRNKIAERLLSLETQGYLNTHDVDYRLRQKICEALGIEDSPLTEL